MRKCDEIANPQSCLNRAKENETVFTLLGRDPSASAAIRAWAEDRIMRGKNKADDEQIVNARALADDMIEEAEAYAAEQNGPQE